MRELSSDSHQQPTSGDDRGVMRSFWKIFAALALMLPLGAFVAGNLVASAADDPQPRHTIVVDDPSGTPSESTPSPSASSPSASPSGGQDDGTAHDQGNDHGDDHGDDHSDAGGLVEVTPTPDSWDDHGGHSGSGGGHHVDSSGPGSGSGSSGSGSSGGGGDDGGGHH